MSETPPDPNAPPPDDETPLADDDETPPADDDETPLAPPADAPPPVDMEKAFKALDREHSRHEKKVAEIMGPDFETMRLCVMCDGIGFMTPDASVVEAYRFNPEANALALVSTDARPDELYRDNPQTQRCETCDGRGQVKTGARPEANAIGTCPTCGGAGWTSKTNVVTMPAAPAQSAPNANVEQLRLQGYTVIEPYQAPPASP